VAAGGASDFEIFRSGVHVSANAFVIKSGTRQVQDLGPMPTPRAVPMITGKGRFIFVAGGIERHGELKDSAVARASKAVDIYDRKHGRWLDRAEIDKKFPGLSRLPERRYGGSMIRVKNRTMDRLYVIGGATLGKDEGMSRNLFSHDPSKRVDIYDFRRAEWSSTEIPTRRMFPALASRSLRVEGRSGRGQKQRAKTEKGKPARDEKQDQGRKTPRMKRVTEILVAGGGTGPLAQVTGNVDPQLYSVEQLRTDRLTWSFGAHLPKQPALGVATAARMSRPTGYLDWAGNALAMNPGCKGGECYLFGFARSFRGEVAGEGEAAGHGASAATGQNVSLTVKVNQD
jgi:hypothetical protein